MQFWEGEVFKTSEFHIIFKKGFSYVIFLTARLKIYHWENRMPVHNPSHPRTSPPSFLAPRLATLCLWLPIQRQRSGLCQDQELEFLCPWRSASKIAIGGTLNRCFFPETSSRSFSTCPTPARTTIPPAAALTMDLSSVQSSGAVFAVLPAEADTGMDTHSVVMLWVYWHSSAHQVWCRALYYVHSLNLRSSLIFAVEVSFTASIGHSLLYQAIANPAWTFRCPFSSKWTPKPLRETVRSKS